MKFTSLLIAVLFSVFTAQAQDDFVSLSADGEELEGVTLSSSAVTNTDGIISQQSFVAAGLRQKKVFGVTDIYVMQVFASNVEEVERQEKSLESLAAQDQVTITMDFVFLLGVNADRIFSAFEETLAENDVDMDTPEMDDFLEAVKEGGKAGSGDRITIVLQKAKEEGGKDTVYLQTPDKNVTKVEGAAGMTKDLLSMWYGEISPNDPHLLNLKNVLTAPAAE